MSNDVLSRHSDSIEAVYDPDSCETDDYNGQESPGIQKKGLKYSIGLNFGDSKEYGKKTKDRKHENS